MTTKTIRLIAYTFNPALTAIQRNGVVLTLRKQGYTCYHETGFDGDVLFTDMPQSMVPIATGFGFTLTPSSAPAIPTSY